MSIKVRPGDLEADRETAIALFARYLNPAYDQRRFDWLYRGNPAGPGRLWMAVEGSTGDVVGTAGAFPRRLSIAGRVELGWVLGDFCVGDGHRTLGPALTLQRVCLEELAADGMRFWYDFPSKTMEAVYRRLGVVSTPGGLLRLARVLRVRDRLTQRWGRSLPIKLSGGVADRLLARWARAPKPHGGLSIHRLEGACGEEFSTLARLAGHAYGVCVERSAEYLNWRYLASPLERHDILCARQDRSLVAYGVLGHRGGITTVYDVFGVPTTEYIAAVLQAAVAYAHGQGSSAVSIALLESHPWAALLRDLGFRRRESWPLVCHAPATGRDNDGITAPWFLMIGDRDA